jgi:pimeloyl-ACP methyl ester carboxylesterase
MSAMPRALLLASAALAALLAAPGLCAQSASFRDESVDVHGIRLHYRIGGTGPPLLLLHGFTGAGVWWDPFVARLAESHTTIVPDLPGHGRSAGGPDPYRFDEVATTVSALMNQLGIARFRAIGYSAGGIVLLHMATQEPGRIEAMAVVAAPHVHSSAAILAFPPFEDHPAQVREYWQEVHPGGEAQVRRLIASFHGLGERVELIDLPAEELSRIEARTLVVIGDRDPEVPVPLALEMHRAIPDAALWVIPMQGHFALWPDWGGSAEAAAIFPDVVTRFLEAGPLAEGSRSMTDRLARLEIATPAGVVLAVGLVLLARRWSRRRELRVYGVGLVVAAAIYPVFGIAHGAPAGHLALEGVGVALFGALAIAGLWRWPLLLAVGWTAHVAWDLAVHHAPGAPWAPGWYPPLCAGFDLFLGGYLAGITARPSTGSAGGSSAGPAPTTRSLAENRIQ